MNTLEEIRDVVVTGRLDDIGTLTEEALAEGASAEEILKEALVPAMEFIGRQMEKGEIFLPEVLLSARVMKASLGVIKPYLQESGVELRGKVVLGTVQGDLHDIGKNLVGMMLEGSGFEVVDLGVDVSTDRFVESVKADKPDIVGMSALLSTTMGQMKRVIEALNQAGIADDVKIMVGGAPLTQGFAEQIGADAYGATAPDAVQIAKRLTGA